jgi:hypothetical protein
MRERKSTTAKSKDFILWVFKYNSSELFPLKFVENNEND